MKKIASYLFIFSLILFSSNQLFSQAFSENFSSNTINSISLNDLGYNDHNAVYWDTSAMYFFDHSVDADCTSTTDWTEASSQHVYYGTEPSGMSGWRAGIKSDSYDCSQDQSIITKRWTATSSTMDISFSYSFRSYVGDAFYVYLQTQTAFSLSKFY